MIRIEQPRTAYAVDPTYYSYASPSLPNPSAQYPTVSYYHAQTPTRYEIPSSPNYAGRGYVYTRVQRQPRNDFQDRLPNGNGVTNGIVVYAGPQPIPAIQENPVVYSTYQDYGGVQADSLHPQTWVFDTQPVSNPYPADALGDIHGLNKYSAPISKSKRKVTIVAPSPEPAYVEYGTPSESTNSRAATSQRSTSDRPATGSGVNNTSRARHDPPPPPQIRILPPDIPSPPDNDAASEQTVDHDQKLKPCKGHGFRHWLHTHFLHHGC
ncbi:hypothetical protein FRC03_009008 [Tulasnella sp. 419]|nr:hypothetical protein FRC03_009008 [Tulasnella sp. 419]